MCCRRHGGLGAEARSEQAGGAAAWVARRDFARCTTRCRTRRTLTSVQERGRRPGAGRARSIGRGLERRGGDARHCAPQGGRQCRDRDGRSKAAFVRRNIRRPERNADEGSDTNMDGFNTGSRSSTNSAATTTAPNWSSLHLVISTASASTARPRAGGLEHTKADRSQRSLLRFHLSPLYTSSSVACRTPKNYRRHVFSLTSRALLPRVISIKSIRHVNRWKEPLLRAAPAALSVLRG